MINILMLSTGTDIDPDVYKTAVVVFVLFLVMVFLTSILRIILDHKLNNRILDKEVITDEMISLLQSNSRDTKNDGILWFLILFSMGVGLVIVNYSQPLGLHSLSIIAISTAIGFLMYSVYIRLISR